MNTYRHIVYMILDEVKGRSDDFSFTEDHIVYLIGKYRAFLLKQRYSDLKKVIPENNYQTISLPLVEVPAICGEICEGGAFLRSSVKVPFLMPLGIPRVYTSDYYDGNISYVPRDRMKFVGYNKYMKNIIYSTIEPDSYLYLTSNNRQFLYLENIKVTGIFQDAEAAALLSCNDNGTCEFLDRELPLEEALIPPMIELIVKEITASEIKNPDEANNDRDDAIQRVSSTPSTATSDAKTTKS